MTTKKEEWNEDVKCLSKERRGRAKHKQYIMGFRERERERAQRKQRTMAQVLKRFFRQIDDNHQVIEMGDRVA